MHPRPPGQSDGAAIPPEPPSSRHAISRTSIALGIRGTNPEQHQPQGTAVIALSTVELPDGPPAASSFGEIRALREPAGLAWRSRRLVAAPRGDGRVVIVGTGVPGRRPGYGAVARVPAPGRIRRARLGPRDQPWPSGERPRPARRNRSGRCHGARSDGPCRLELGGVIVREVARELPDHVDGVVLFGSPIIGGPMHTIAARTFDPAEAALATAALAALDAERPVRVPLTSI